MMTEPIADTAGLPGLHHPRRPAVTVVVPFLGGASDAREMLAVLRCLRLRAGDELLVADNTESGHVVAAVDAERLVRTVDASAVRSSDHARNVGAAAATNHWLLFMDADCKPAPDLLDAYFHEPVPDDFGAVAGGITSGKDQSGLLPAYARSRRHHDAGALYEHSTYGATAGTPNLLVRRAAFDAVGGILPMYGGGDAEFSWRVQAAGWRLGYRPGAEVEHRHRQRLLPFLRQAVRWGAGHAWLERRRPGTGPRPKLVQPLVRCALGMVGWTLRGQRRRGLFKGLDALWICGEALGYLRSNGPRIRTVPERPSGRGPIAVCTPTFGDAGAARADEVVAALADAGWATVVEARARPQRLRRTGIPRVQVHFWDDDGIARRLAGLALLLSRHPARCLRDDALWRRGRARGESRVPPLSALAPAAERIRRSGVRQLYVTGAGDAAADGLRLSRLLGLPCSVGDRVEDKS